MLFKSQVLTQASGSVGGMTYTRTRSGLTVRARSVPVQPVSPFRAAVQSALAALSILWSQTLTDAERAAWTLYAANTPYVNALGDPLILSGQQIFIACNTPRLQATQPAITTAPTIFGLGSLAAYGINYVIAAGVGTLSFLNTDQWANDTGGALLIYVSQAVPIARNFFKGPYRYAGKVDGDPMTPPTSPATISPVPAVGVGQKVFYRVFAYNGDGRLTNQVTGSLIAT